jgi:hypothetical protein
MAVATLPAGTLDQAVEFINDKKNDVDHVWVYKKSIFLGSFLPKTFGKIQYDSGQIHILVYIQSDEGLKKETLCITNDDFLEYRFDYV